MLSKTSAHYPRSDWTTAWVMCFIVICSSVDMRFSGYGPRCRSAGLDHGDFPMEFGALIEGALMAVHRGPLLELEVNPLQS